MILTGTENNTNISTNIMTPNPSYNDIYHENTIYTRRVAPFCVRNGVKVEMNFYNGVNYLNSLIRPLNSFYAAAIYSYSATSHLGAYDKFVSDFNNANGADIKGDISVDITPDKAYWGLTQYKERISIDLNPFSVYFSTTFFDRMDNFVMKYWDGSQNYVEKMRNIISHTSAHETGHVVGMLHSADGVSIMDSTASSVYPLPTEFYQNNFRTFKLLKR